MAESTRLGGAALSENTSGFAAVEFAMILPILLVLFFGTVEISNAVAVYRKVTLMAHTLSDLTSQSTGWFKTRTCPIFLRRAPGL